MQLATAQANPAPVSLAVCYGCSYQSNACASACPRCNFPLITSSELSPAAGIRLADVLHRDSIRLGAPPLPGVHPEPRKAQQQAEARRARLVKSADEHSPPTLVDEESSRGPSPRGSVWNKFFLCLSAVGIGVAAAAMQSVI